MVTNLVNCKVFCHQIKNLRSNSHQLGCLAKMKKEEKGYIIIDFKYFIISFECLQPSANITLTVRLIGLEALDRDLGSFSSWFQRERCYMLKEIFIQCIIAMINLKDSCIEKLYLYPTQNSQLTGVLYRMHWESNVTCDCFVSPALLKMHYLVGKSSQLYWENNKTQLLRKS